MEQTIFIAVAAAALLLQALVMLGMFLAVRKSGERMEALAEEVKTKVLPTVETVNSMLVELRPKVESTITNVSDATTMVKAQMARLDATVNDALDRGRLQIIRADELVTRTLDKVEETTEAVHKTVIFPVRQLSGIIHGVSAGLEFLIGSKRRRNNGAGVPQDEMFI